MPARLLVATGLMVVALEAAFQGVASGALRGPAASLVQVVMGPALVLYLPFRAWVLSHPVAAGVSGCGGVGRGTRGLQEAAVDLAQRGEGSPVGHLLLARGIGVPSSRLRAAEAVRVRPQGTTFVGLEARRGFWGWEVEPLLRADAAALLCTPTFWGRRALARQQYVTERV